MSPFPQGHSLSFFRPVKVLTLPLAYLFSLFLELTPKFPILKLPLPQLKLTGINCHRPEFHLPLLSPLCLPFPPTWLPLGKGEMEVLSQICK